MAAGPVTILLTNFNGLANLQACLPGVLVAASRGDIPCDVLLVDDGSTDESVSWLARHHPQVKVVAQPTNGGFLAAANAGFAAATTCHVALLSNDMVPRADFLSVLLPHFADPSVFAVASCLGDPAGRPEGGRSVGLFLAGTLYVRPLVKAIGTRNVFSASTVDQMPKHVSSGLMFGYPLVGDFRRRLCALDGEP